MYVAAVPNEQMYHNDGERNPRVRLERVDSRVGCRHGEDMLILRGLANDRGGRGEQQFIVDVTGQALAAPHRRRSDGPPRVA